MSTGGPEWIGVGEIIAARDRLLASSETWATLSRLMRRTGRTLAGAPTGGLAPRVTDAAQAFLEAWAAYAADSARAAVGFSEALFAISRDFEAVDERAGLDFGALVDKLREVW